MVHGVGGHLADRKDELIGHCRIDTIRQGLTHELPGRPHRFGGRVEVCGMFHGHGVPKPEEAANQFDGEDQ